MKKRRGPGRPPIPAPKRKLAIFSVRLSDEERRLVDRAASARGLTSSRWARDILLEAASHPLLPLAPTPT